MAGLQRPRDATQPTLPSGADPPGSGLVPGARCRGEEPPIDSVGRVDLNDRVSDSQFRLDGRVAVVTGGSRGIGRAAALGLGQAGADVVVAARKAQDLDVVAAEIRSLGRRALAVPAHLGRREEIDRLFQAVMDTFGRLDVLVNNAATNPVFGPLLEIDEEAWDRIMAINVKGYLLAAQRAARAMAPLGRGAIINVASTAGLRASAGLGAYSVSKAAVIMLTRVLGRELAPSASG